MSLSRRVKAAGLHLLFSALVVALVAVVVFGLWFPYPYREIAGGTSLFALIMSVDLCMGPLLTAVAASPSKPRPELRRDISVIVFLQLAALIYGIYTVALARPVYLSFEIDRFRVVSAADVDASELDRAPEGLRSLPWLGPRTIAAVKPTDPAEQLRSIDLALAGLDLSMVPSNWREYEPLRPSAWRAARPIEMLTRRYPEQAPAVRALAQHRGTRVDELRFLPLMSRRASWTVVLSGPDARIVGYLPVDGFL